MEATGLEVRVGSSVSTVSGVSGSGYGTGLSNPLVDLAMDHHLIMGVFIHFWCTQ